MQSADWDDLVCELDLWTAQSRQLELWWRDDDAGAPEPALRQLLDLTALFGIEVGLAVVPAAATEAIAKDLLRRAGVVVLQHGFAHKNHAPVGGRAVECGGERPVKQVIEEMRRGFRRLEALFGPRFEPILAPPWNRIEPEVVAGLADTAFKGLTASGPRPRREALPGIVWVNTHVDPMRWRGGARFGGEGKVLADIVTAIAMRRTGKVDSDEPFGLLTHHRYHDRAAWDFLERLLQVTAAHPAARWLGVRDAFWGRRSPAAIGPGALA